MRTTVAATLVVLMCLLLAGAALLMVLYHSLASSAQSTADARAAQVADQLQTEPPPDLDRAMLATDSQVGVVQVIDRQGDVVVASAASPETALSSTFLEPGARRFFGRVEIDPSNDFWVTGVGAQTPTGPVTVLVAADREPVESVVATVAGLLAVGVPIVICLVAYGTHRLVGAALQPVERIRAKVSLVTSGKLAERIPVPLAEDEVTRLAVTMNEMLDRLEAGQAAQQRFISDASHELRSPLATITTALELAHDQPEMLDDALIEESLLPEANRMQRLVADLLLLARTDEDSALRSYADVDVDDLLIIEAERVKTITGLSVATHISHVRVVGDPRALARLVRNLVDNATRHARSCIALQCRRVGDHAQIVIQDDGPGVPVAERARVFDRFVRLDSPRTRESGGAGLGLSIVAQIVETHRGRVTLDESPSGGARFVVELPLFVDQPVADTADGLDLMPGRG
ncbi:signal transduction histidine kinase [Mycolicibacterium rhodesiae NBB3]|uniref:histidine kinase n=2 Tax=Mycolicibacterium rhodesiae TaxID=36814 RepID=G8RLP8_MYCRN|nr:signal transduction histidine kinase [Mycolicibacterium rhodesiae NBB3]